MDNAFQKAEVAQSQTAKEIHEKALKEFDDTVSLLKSNLITVIVFNDNPVPTKPDAVYDNLKNHVRKTFTNHDFLCK